MSAPLTATECEREIRELHAFFVEWYCGRSEQGGFERLERALAPGFERVAPDASVATRSEVIEGVRGTYDEYETFEIEIRNVDPIRVGDERALVRYEEWQTTPDGSNGRLSSVLFGPTEGETDSDRATAASWLYLHESWLEAPE